MRRIGLACATLLALQGCNCGGAHTHGNQGEVTFAPGLQFGIAGVGESVSRTAKLSNVGSARVLVDSIEVTAPFSACVKHSDDTCTATAELAIGETVDVVVTYAPTAPAASDGVNDVSLVTVVNDSTTPRASITAVGHAVAARLVVTPLELDFGEVAAGVAKELPLLLENKGVAAIVLSSPAIDNALFATDLGKLQGTLDRGGSISTKVTYTPNAGQDDSGTLTIGTDVGAESVVKVVLKGTGLDAKVSLCFNLAGDTPTCLPDAQGHLSGALDFGVLDETATRQATVILKSEGNLQVDLFGTATAEGLMASDETARTNPCAQSPASADFTFTPTEFARRLPADPTAQEPNPPRQQSMEVSYAPHHHCPADLTDGAVISLKAGSSPSAPTFFLDIRGASKLGVVQAEDVYWEVPTVTPKDYVIHNVGPGPLHVTSVEIVEANDKPCSEGCETRKLCSASALPECGFFNWSSGPAPVEIPGAPAGGISKATIGVLQNVPAVLCGGLGAADGGLCFPTQTIRVCTRVTSDDPFRAKACGELKSHTF